MLNLQKVKADYCKTQIQEAYQRTYSDMEKGLGNIIIWTAHLALENIANSDALYHDAEHTIMVTLAGQSILEGKHLSEGRRIPKRLGAFHDRPAVPRHRLCQGNLCG